MNRRMHLIAALLAAACAESPTPQPDAGVVEPDAAVVVEDAGVVLSDAGAGVDAGRVSEDIGFGPVGDCLEDSECDDGTFCNGIERCLEGTCVEGEPACETRGCLSSCDEINDRCFDELVPQAYLCDEIHCAIASCDNRGRCSYESRPEYACRTAEMQPCQSTYQCREGLACFGGEFFNDGNNRCVEPCTGNEDCELGITRCETSIGGRPFNHCLYNLCGGRFGGTMLDACDGTGADSGSCYPLPDGAGGYLGVCYEGGPRAEGESCSGGVYPWPKRGETQGRCQGGLWCHSGQCRQLCSLSRRGGLPNCPAQTHCGDTHEGEDNDAGVCLPGARCVVTQRHCGTVAACVPDSTASLIGGCQAVSQPAAPIGAACEIPSPGELSPCADGAMCWLDFRNPLSGASCLQFCDLSGADCPAGTACRPTDSRRGATRGEQLGLCYPTN
ncbi:MAG: hypothetical protein VYB65_10785 [Myxococcota bacterium]|nr:hypothetical protein [Myxococcota bacterium]